MGSHHGFSSQGGQDELSSRALGGTDTAPACYLVIRRPRSALALTHVFPVEPHDHPAHHPLLRGETQGPENQEACPGSRIKYAVYSLDQNLVLLPPRSSLLSLRKYLLLKKKILPWKQMRASVIPTALMQTAKAGSCLTLPLWTPTHPQGEIFSVVCRVASKPLLRTNTHIRTCAKYR